MGSTKERIPIAKFTTPELLGEYLRRVERSLSRLSKLVIVINPLLGEPATTPRDREWCSSHCNPSNNQLDEIAESVKKLGFEVKIKK